MGSFGKWLAGIVGSIIVGCAIFYLTRPKPVLPPPPPPAVTTFEGLIYSGGAPVPKAMVAVNLTGDPASNGAAHNFTDDNGSYRIDFTGLPSGTGATLQVTATGYQDAGAKSLASPLQFDNRLDFALTPAAETAGQGTGVKPPPLTVFHMPPYVRKDASHATQFHIR